MELTRICPVCNKSFTITDEFTIKWITESPNVVSCCSNECAVNSMGTIIKPILLLQTEEIKQLERKEAWLPETAISLIDEYLQGAGCSLTKIFEFGCGSSTLWFSEYSFEVISVEHDKEW